jgi:hypothetical protein
MTKYNWPSREKWAEQHRSAYWDFESPHPYTASGDLSVYASPEEIAASIAELQKMWRDCGREMKAATAEVGSLARRPGERGRSFIPRFFEMSEADRERAGKPEEFRFMRREINRMIKELREGSVPSKFSRLPIPALDIIVARYEVAVEAGNAKYRAECAALPVDDAAWERELAQRRLLEERELARRRRLEEAAS